MEQYDLHDSTNCVFHYMVADSTGRSAILEWVGSDADHDSDGSQRRLNVLWNDTDSLSDSADWQVVTNFIKTPDYYTSPDQMHGLDRYEHLADRLRETNGIVVDEDAAMALLAEVGRRTWNNDDSNSLTVHSAVYNLTDKTVLWVGNEQEPVFSPVTSKFVTIFSSLFVLESPNSFSPCLVRCVIFSIQIVEY